MMQTHPVPKDLMFKLRLDAQDRERLEAVAAHYSAPAATAVRILVKEKYDEIAHRAASREKEQDQRAIHKQAMRSTLAALAEGGDKVATRALKELDSAEAKPRSPSKPRKR